MVPGRHGADEAGTVLPIVGHIHVDAGDLRKFKSQTPQPLHVAVLYSGPRFQDNSLRWCLRQKGAGNERKERKEGRGSDNLHNLHNLPTSPSPFYA